MEPIQIRILHKRMEDSGKSGKNRPIYLGNFPNRMELSIQNALDMSPGG